MAEISVLNVAVPTPAADIFDYLPSSGLVASAKLAGCRAKVNFGRRILTGMIVGHSSHTEVPPSRLRPILRLLDAEPILEQQDLQLLRWAALYYHHPLGEVIAAALSRRLRKGLTAALPEAPVWQLTHDGGDIEALRGALQRAPRQTALAELLKAHPGGLDAERISTQLCNWRQPLKELLRKGLVAQIARQTPPHRTVNSAPPLNADQTAAAEVIAAGLGRYTPFLLEGVTGSGKTEVYLELIQKVVAAGRQALVLVPEIALTPQLVTRFRARLAAPLVVLHSGLRDTERHCAWAQARSGDASIIIGTRSAVFTPLASPGIIIVDEEHDASLKQQEGFRYHARDLAVYRASIAGIPVVLGSATPSLESLHNAERGRYVHVRLSQRARQASLPSLEIVDVRRVRLEDGLSPHVVKRIGACLDAGDQVLVFLNRRGFAPVLMCHDCGWAAACQRCDAWLTLHAGRARLCCHHCGAEHGIDACCPSCGSGQLLHLGAGTERIEHALKRAFPNTALVRVDRDTTRRRGELQTKLAGIEQGRHQLLIGTQMLSKGHDFPNLTLAVILNVDQHLHSSDFHATERAAQSIVQVSGRAGRGVRPGAVIIQTHLPDNPLLRSLLRGGYPEFSGAALRERRAAGLPPYSRMALIRAEAVDDAAPLKFLRRVRDSLESGIETDIDLLGPAPAPMERRAGRHRAQLLLIARRRARLKALLHDLTTELRDFPGARKVRWTIDVDPVDLL
ncbi:MAG: primosomal protein N' [Gammaproteobacteria bacterium]